MRLSKERLNFVEPLEKNTCVRGDGHNIEPVIHRMCQSGHNNLLWNFSFKSRLWKRESKQFSKNFETPLPGIYFRLFSVKMDILEGKANPVLKIYAYLIISKSEKQKKKHLKILENFLEFFIIFPEFFGSRSLHFRGLFFLRPKFDFLQPKNDMARP